MVVASFSSANKCRMCWLDIIMAPTAELAEHEWSVARSPRPGESSLSSSVVTCRRLSSVPPSDPAREATCMPPHWSIAERRQQPVVPACTSML